MYYQIEMLTSYGQWEPLIVQGDPNELNRFDSVEDAEKDIQQLRELDEDWAAGEYRVVEAADDDA